MAQADSTSLLLMECQPASCTMYSKGTLNCHIAYIDHGVGKNIEKDTADHGVGKNIEKDTAESL